MEGVQEEECYEQAKNEGSKVEVVWQDGESSTAKSITLQARFINVENMWVELKAIAWKRLLSFRKMWKPSTKRNFRNWNCEVQMQTTQGWLWLHTRFSDQSFLYKTFVLSATVHWSRWLCRVLGCFWSTMCVTSIPGTKMVLVTLIQWELALARNVKEDEIKCTGEPYKTKLPLKCAFHWLAYKIECKKRAQEADSVIHPQVGRGHSNLCEASIKVLLKTFKNTLNHSLRIVKRL